MLIGPIECTVNHRFTATLVDSDNLAPLMEVWLPFRPCYMDPQNGSVFILNVRTLYNDIYKQKIIINFFMHKDI